VAKQFQHPHPIATPRRLQLSVAAGGNEPRIAHIRKRLLEVLKELCDEKSHDKRLGEGDAKRWTLTIALVPAAAGLNPAKQVLGKSANRQYAWKQTSGINTLS